MIDLTGIQKEVFENKKRRGWNTTDVGKEIILLTEEIVEDNKTREHRSAIFETEADEVFAK